MEGKSRRMDTMNLKEMAGEFWVVFALGTILLSAVFYKVLT